MVNEVDCMEKGAWKNKRACRYKQNKKLSLTAASQQSIIIFQVQVRGRCMLGKKYEMQTSYFWDKITIRNTHPLIRGTKLAGDMGRKVRVINSPKFGTGYPHSPEFGTKSEYVMGLTVTQTHSPKFRPCGPYSLRCWKRPVFGHVQIPDVSNI